MPDLLRIDRRIIYLAILAVLIPTVIKNNPEESIILPSVQKLYDAIENAPAGPDDHKLVLVGTPFGGSTLPENGNQLRAIIRHLMLAKKRFALIAINEPQGARLGLTISQELAKQYDYKYGEDWLSFGYQYGPIAFFKDLIRNIPDAIKVDAVNSQPVGSYSVMKGIHSMKNVAMYIEITAAATVQDWIQIVQPTTVPRLLIGYACTSVMASEAYPLMDSGQLTGMLPGLKGAADYEQLVDERVGKISEYKIPGILTSSARRLMFSQGFAQIVIIIFVILGNIGFIISKRKRSALSQGAA
jgi:hypothetical protein